MLPSFFGFSRYPTDGTPGHAILWWTLGRGQLEHAITHVGNCNLNHAGPTGDTLRMAAPMVADFIRAGLTGDLLES